MSSVCDFAKVGEACSGEIVKVGEKKSCQRHYEDAIVGKWVD